MIRHSEEELKVKNLISKFRPNVSLAQSLKGDTVYESFQNSFNYFKDRPCLGTRKRIFKDEKNEEVTLGEYEWNTYQDTYDRSIMIGNGLRQFIDTRSFLSICANNCIEWTLTDLACIWHGIRVVPLHHQSSKDKIEEIMNNCQSNSIVVTPDIVDKIIELVHDNQLPCLKVIILIGPPPQRERDLIATLPSHIQVKEFKEIESIGREMVDLVPHSPFRSDELFGLMYSSGSTGSPKGIMLMDNLFNQTLVNGTLTAQPSIHLSFLTLSHVQRKIDLITLFSGGQIGMYSGSMETIFDDIQTLSPTMFACISRFYNIVYDHCNLLKLLNQKDKIKEVLGNRIQVFVAFGAFTNQTTKDFMSDNWPHVPFIDVYGQNEDTGCGLSQNGVIISDSTQIRLEPVPELGYSPDDKPFPRGELVIKKPTFSPGYYNRPDLTEQQFIDGWYYSGDIVSIDSNNILTMIDRKKHVFKLANGEFVAPENLETHYINSTMIESILIYGDIYQSFLVGIIVPSNEMKIKYPKADDGRLVDELESIIYQDLLRIAREVKLANYEVPKFIKLDYDTVWSEANQLLTQSSKTCRHALYSFYKSTINSMYQSHNTNNISQLIKSVLNIHDDNSNSLSFTQLGGDSLSAIKLSHILKEKINIDIPTSIILNIDNDLSKLTDLLGQFINNNDKTNLKNQEINWENEIKLDESIQKGNKTVKDTQKKNQQRFNVFLTGSTGYLGSYLLYQLLADERVEKIYCLIRNTSLKESIDIIDQLNTKYRLDVDNGKRNTSRVVIVHGDLSLIKFGLSDEAFLNLANQVNLLIHNGALVNMAIPYNNTRAANVTSTIEMLKLSTAGDHLIPLSHISSVGVFHLEDQQEMLITEQTIPSLSNLDKLNGYRQSKLVAEQIIREAYARGFPITMHRPGTIYADSRTGVDNENDLVRMITKGLLYMKSYPSQDKEKSAASSPLPSYNLVPVDWVSKSIIQLSLNHKEDQDQTTLPIYHMINETNTSIATIGQVIRDSGLIGEMREISLERWQKELIDCTESNPLYPMKSIVSNNNRNSENQNDDAYTYKVQFKTPFTTNSLKGYQLDPCQPISTINILKNIQYLNESSGFLKK
ncbi:hypothetical protein DFA_11118 [Cavenderia fasciculata]|uniref:Carrier domain-containing protein n=1 Tax=Cavenderia fasciculata TaxID=261658 RepID=F4QEZ8_CACFS|nr:uncharacterized protein DFA_11118 [Cavenderia fasciculata]EGG13357.1 hypothetical protein DFA_11118 [Cavenderia fasciculata]|eukprot:XP_004350061.1 hypothetical protein DFA_11118 [Cavenderia fasciculata]